MTEQATPDGLVVERVTAAFADAGFELFSDLCLQLVEKHFSALRSPFAARHPQHVLLEISDAESEAHAAALLESVAGDALERAIFEYDYVVEVELPEGVTLMSTTDLKGRITYANEADLLNVALFGQTACEWRDANPEKAARLDDPMFVQRCALESMRLHPSSPTAGRRPTCPMHLPTGQDVNKQDMVSVDLMTANRETSVFGPDAAEYNPHRPAPKGASPYGLSFGMGMHACIGLNLAAGALPRSDSVVQSHQWGTVTLIALELLESGARPDPDRPGVVDRTTIRNNWSSYPMLLGN